MYENENKVPEWRSPPHNTLSRIGRQKEIRAYSHSLQKKEYNTYIVELRRAFENADTQKKGKITINEWKNSMIKCLIDRKIKFLYNLK